MASQLLPGSWRSCRELRGAPGQAPVAEAVGMGVRRDAARSGGHCRKLRSWGRGGCRGLLPVLLVWACMCCRTRWMSSGLVRSICSSVSLGEQLLRSSWAPGPCGSSTLANTRKPMASKCRAVACPKPESQPVRAEGSPSAAGDSHQPAAPSPQGPRALPLHPQGPNPNPQPASVPTLGPPSSGT